LNVYAMIEKIEGTYRQELLDFVHACSLPSTYFSLCNQETGGQLYLPI